MSSRPNTPFTRCTWGGTTNPWHVRELGLQFCHPKREPHVSHFLACMGALHVPPCGSRLFHMCPAIIPRVKEPLGLHVCLSCNILWQLYFHECHRQVALHVARPACTAFSWGEGGRLPESPLYMHLDRIGPLRRYCEEIHMFLQPSTRRRAHTACFR